MNEDRSIELIHGELDGELSAPEQEELAARMQSDPGLKSLMDDMRKLSGVLDRVPQADPPPGLRSRIMAAVRPRKRRGILEALLPDWPAPVTLRYAGAAAFGAAVAAVALQLGTTDFSGPADVRGLVGTIASYETPAAAQNIISLDTGGITGSIETHRQNGLLVMDFDLAAEQPLQIVADYSHSGLDFGGFAQLDGSAASLDATNGQITFAQGRDHRYAVFFEAAEVGDGTIELRFLTDQKLVRKETVEISAMSRE
ncbi:MAG: hypothetical protein PVI25_10235 [Gammaproteobacteria bacterium]|jgi:hypothetical protein|nr:MAG: hypothetical protein AMJ59_25965 [Gammaproteobacteria bacterium SG8_31]